MWPQLILPACLFAYDVNHNGYYKSCVSLFARSIIWLIMSSYIIIWSLRINLVYKKKSLRINLGAVFCIATRYRFVWHIYKSCSRVSLLSRSIIWLIISSHIACRIHHMINYVFTHHYLRFTFRYVC